MKRSSRVIATGRSTPNCIAYGTDDKGRRVCLRQETRDPSLDATRAGALQFFLLNDSATTKTRP